MTRDNEINFKKKVLSETISRKDELIDAAKRNAAIVSEFLKGAEYADSNPRKGLVDIDKACEWLKNDMIEEQAFYNRLERMAIIDGIVDKFRKAMLKEE